MDCTVQLRNCVYMYGTYYPKAGFRRRFWRSYRTEDIFAAIQLIQNIYYCYHAHTGVHAYVPTVVQPMCGALYNGSNIWKAVSQAAVSGNAKAAAQAIVEAAEQGERHMHYASTTAGPPTEAMHARVVAAYFVPHLQEDVPLNSMAASPGNTAASSAHTAMCLLATACGGQYFISHVLPSASALQGPARQQLRLKLSVRP